MTERLAHDLHLAFPEMKGFSARDLKDMSVELALLATAAVPPASPRASHACWSISNEWHVGR